MQFILVISKGCIANLNLVNNTRPLNCAQAVSAPHCVLHAVVNTSKQKMRCELIAHKVIIYVVNHNCCAFPVHFTSIPSCLVD